MRAGITPIALILTETLDGLDKIKASPILLQVFFNLILLKSVLCKFSTYQANIYRIGLQEKFRLLAVPTKVPSCPNCNMPFRWPTKT